MCDARPSMSGMSSGHQVPATREAEDARKDREASRFLLAFDCETRAPWLERLGWVRLVDRLAEVELAGGSDLGFSKYRRSWEAFLASGRIEGEPEVVAHLQALHRTWYDRGGEVTDPVSVSLWDDYVEAIARYHQPGQRIRTLDEFDRMLMRLSGPILEIVPRAPRGAAAAVRALGAADQLYNDLRDLAEDAARGMCLLPEDEMARFAVSRDDLLEMRFEAPRIREFLAFMLDAHGARWSARASELKAVPELHPTWAALVPAFERRHQRIAKCLHACNFDPVRFAERYWSEMAAE